MNYQLAMKFAEDKGLFKSLENIYNEVPECRGCIGCKSCCSESVNTTYVEYLYILKKYYPHYQGLASLDRNQSKRILSFFFKSMTVPQKCPFLSIEGLCEIYDARPLACRVFGTKSKIDYMSNHRKIVTQNLKMAKDIEKIYGDRPSDAMIHRLIPFCDYVKTPEFATDEMSQKWQDQLVNMEGSLYFNDMMSMSVLNGDLVSHFIHSTFADLDNLVSMELVQAIRVELMRDYADHQRKLRINQGK